LNSNNCVLNSKTNLCYEKSLVIYVVVCA
jgi:hypothetical protein